MKEKDLIEWTDTHSKYCGNKTKDIVFFLFLDNKTMLLFKKCNENHDDCQIYENISY